MVLLKEVQLGQSGRR